MTWQREARAERLADSPCSDITEHCSDITEHWEQWRRAATDVVEDLDLDLPVTHPVAPVDDREIDAVLGDLAAWQRELIAHAQAHSEDTALRDALAEMVTSLAAMRVAVSPRVPFPR